MDTLREKIAALFAVARRAGADGKPGDPDDFATLVLEIPEIKEALELKSEQSRVIRVLAEDGFTWETVSWLTVPGTPPESPVNPHPKREA